MFTEILISEPVEEWYKSPTFLIALAALQFAIIVALVACYIRKTKKSKDNKPQSGLIKAFDHQTTLPKMPRPSSITKLSSASTGAGGHPPYPAFYSTPYSPTISNSDFEPFEKIHTTSVNLNDPGYASGSLGSKSGSDVVATLEGSSHPTSPPFNPYLSGGGSSTTSSSLA